MLHPGDWEAAAPPDDTLDAETSSSDADEVAETVYVDGAEIGRVGSVPAGLVIPDVVMIDTNEGER